MRLPATQRAALDALASEAHRQASTEDGYATHDAAVAFVGLIRDLERFGKPWVDAILHRFMVDGAKVFLSNWRARQRVSAHTAKGASVTLPAFIGKRARGRYVQAPLADLDITAAEAFLQRTTTTRNTLSRQIRLVTDAIDMARAKGITFAEALDRLEQAA